MKIQINYELFEKIADAKTGFSLKRFSLSVLKASCFVTLVSIPLEGSSLQRFLYSLMFQTTFQGMFFGFVIPPTVKANALSVLKDLAVKLNRIDVPTNVDLLQEAYKYETEYKINTDSSVPKIQKNTYFMVPIQENGQQKEVSLVEEHIVGEKSYTISHGSPSKVLKLSLGRAAS